MKAGTKEYYAEYYQRNKEKHNETMKRFKKENVEQHFKELEYHREKYHKDKENIDDSILKQRWRDQALKNYKKKKQFIAEYKSTCSCKKCGENRPYVLDFHHVNPNEKDFDIGNISQFSLNKIKQEIEKCITLCRNCHSEFHYLKKEQNITIDQYLLTK